MDEIDKDHTDNGLSCDVILAVLALWDLFIRKVYARRDTLSSGWDNKRGGVSRRVNMQGQVEVAWI